MIYLNFFKIPNLMIYSRHLKKILAFKSYSKKVTGLSIFTELLRAVREV